MRTTAIVIASVTMLSALACQTGQMRSAPEKLTLTGVEIPREELAAERVVPRRTNATSARAPGAAPERSRTPVPAPAESVQAASQPVAPVAPRQTKVEPVPPTPPPAENPPEPSVEPTPAAPTSAPATQPPLKIEKEEEGALVLVPSQGRPIMLAPGDTFYFVMRLRRALGQRITCWLVHSQVHDVRFPLQADVRLGIVQGRYGQMILQVPPKVIPGLYDIEVQGEGRSYFSRQSVKVVDQWRDRFRIVHLSNMNIDDPAAPEFDSLLIDEINLLAPEFIVCTGDFTQWGRALGDPNDWTRALRFLERINAPAYVVCGDHDDEQSFDRFVADNPIGTFDYGNYHGILMLDHSAHRIENEQVKWLKSELESHRNLRGFNFVVMHNDELDVLDMLRRQVDDLPRFLKDHKLRMIVTGGHADWDLREFATKLKDLQGPGGLVYVRTHESSTCMHDRATGVSRYRVIEINDNEIDCVYPDDIATSTVQHSVPVGRLRTFYSRPNDGTSDQVIATVQNALNQGFENCRIWLRVAKRGQNKPAVAGGELVRVLDGQTHWVCEVRVDLPDKGGVKVMAASESALLPPQVPVTVTMTMEGTTQPATTTRSSALSLTFTQEHADDGMVFYRSSQKAAIVLTNSTSAAQEVWPIVRLNGDELPLVSAGGDRRPLTIEPGRSVSIPLRLVLGRISPGHHQLQVFFLSDPLKRLTVFPTTLKWTAR